MLGHLSPIEIVGYVCTALAVIVVLGIIFSARLQKALLTGESGEMEVKKVLLLRGVTGVIMLGLLLAPAAYAAYLKQPVLEQRIADKDEEIKGLQQVNDTITKKRDDLAVKNAALESDKRKLQLELEDRTADPINRVQIGVKTGTYGAGQEEPVTFSILHKGRCMGEETFDFDWPQHREKEVVIDLLQPIPEAYFKDTVFRVEKMAHRDINHDRWDASFEVDGVLADGRTVDLIDTPTVTIGGGMRDARCREFVPRDREILPANHRSLYQNIWVAHEADEAAGEAELVTELVTGGFLCNGRGMVPIGDLRGELLMLGVTIKDRGAEGLELRMPPGTKSQ
jgi:hypothetical protein